MKYTELDWNFTKSDEDNNTNRLPVQTLSKIHDKVLEVSGIIWQDTLERLSLRNSYKQDTNKVPWQDPWQE